MSENRAAKIDGPMTFGYGIDAADERSRAVSETLGRIIHVAAEFI
jgi:hypothetical protein